MRRSSAIACSLLWLGAPALADFQISPGDSASHSYPSVCRRPDGFIAAWESRGASGSDITVQPLDGRGRPSGAAGRANQESAGDQQLPDLACRGDGSFLVVWESRDQDGDGLGIFARNFDADGTPGGDELQVNTHTTDNQRRPRVCVASDGAVVVVWESVGQDGDSSGIYARRYDADTVAAGGEFLVSDNSTTDQSEAAIACADDGRQLVAWTSQRPAGSEVRARLVNANGELDERVFRLTSDDLSPAHHAGITATDSGSFAVAVEAPPGNIVLATVGVPLAGGSELSLRPLPLAKRNEAPTIASGPTGNILVAWSSGSGFDFEIGALRATPGFASERVITLNAGRRGNDGALSSLGRGIAIAPAPDGDLVLWQKRDVRAADSRSAIFAERFADCRADCSGDQVVRVNELILAVRIALEQATLDVCASIDGNGNGNVEVNEIIAAVREALAGVCPAPIG